MTTTARIYAAAQEAFLAWCGRNGVIEADHTDIALYLRDIRQSRGPAAVPVHLSAIAAMYRARGLPLDVKADVIQAIIRPVRAALRARRG